MYIIRGRTVWIERHAADAMNAEKPPIQVYEIIETLENPDRTIKEKDGRVKAMKWVNVRTIIVYYDEDKEDIYVKGTSATRRKIT